MKLINHVKGTTTKQIYCFETKSYIYDDSNEAIEHAEMIRVFNRYYFIDSKVTDEYQTIIVGHRYETTRKLKHTITLIIDYNNMAYHYDMKKYDIA